MPCRQPSKQQWLLTTNWQLLQGAWYIASFYLQLWQSAMLPRPAWHSSTRSLTYYVSFALHHVLSSCKCHGTAFRFDSEYMVTPPPPKTCRATPTLPCNQSSWLEFNILCKYYDSCCQQRMSAWRAFVVEWCQTSGLQLLKAKVKNWQVIL